MPITELARRLGLSRKAVTGHIERGTVPAACLERGPYGWVITDAEGAKAAILDALELRGVVDDSDEKKYANINFNDRTTWPRDAKGLQIVREYWAADGAQRKADLAAQELVKTADVHRELFSAVRLIRDQLLTFPDRAADDLAAELAVPDATPVRIALQKTIDRMLTDLSDGLERALLAAGAGAAGDDGESQETDGGAGPTS